jgi:hypothetical protein
VTLDNQKGQMNQPLIVYTLQASPSNDLFPIAGHRGGTSSSPRRGPWRLDIGWHSGFSNGTGFQAYIGDTIVSFRHLKIGPRSGPFAVLQTSSGLKGRHNLAQGRAQGQGPAAPPWVTIPMNYRRPEKGATIRTRGVLHPFRVPFRGGPVTQGAAPVFALHSALGHFILPLQGYARRSLVDLVS